ncbi:MAG: UDP-N-acetylmuramoyl-L-alanine--D-glutamate ligase [Actinomycetota bacterium]
MTALVIGAAVSGRAAARLLRVDGDKVVAYDRDPAALDGIEADETYGGEWDRRLLEGIDLVVASPGVPEHAPPIADALAAGVPLWSELELGYRHVGVPVIAVTATNGKTTITEVAAEMLNASGIRSAAVGNIGEPLSGAVGLDVDVLVVEASSFQLRFVETFHARAAVLLNVAPDHLDWHGGWEAYRSAKRRILERQDPTDVVVYDADDPGAVDAVVGASARLVPVSGSRRPTGGWGRDGADLVIGDAVIPIATLPRGDDVMVVDLAAAASAAMHLGATAAGVSRVAVSYRPRHHRREIIGTWGGVTWVDDSKATNPHAALAAIRAYPSVVLIAGGRNKGLDVGVIALEANLSRVIAIGEAAADLVATGGPVTVVAGLDAAVELADQVSRPGDTVLLAPGCASFDMFESYGDRGQRFTDTVLRIKGV